MRLIASLAEAPAARARGLGDAASDQLQALQAQLLDVEKQIAALSNPPNRYFIAVPGAGAAYAADQLAKMQQLQAQATAIQAQISIVQSKPATAASTAQAIRDTVSQQQSLVEVAMGPKYDYGRGSNKRNSFYKSLGLSDAPTSATAELTSFLIPKRDAHDLRTVPNWELVGSSPNLGGNMQRILDLDRPSLGFDIFGAITKGAEAGYQKYKAEAAPSASPALKIPNPLAGVLPDWLTKAQLPASVRDIGGGVVSSVAKAATSKTAPNPNAVAQTTVASVPAPARSSGVNWLLWGGVAAGGIVLWKVLKSRS